MRPAGENRIWLFSFADLAFLLLIAFTQASTIGKTPVSIGEMTLPKVVEGPQITPFSKQARFYQVRIHKPSASHAEENSTPFQIIRVNKDGTETAGFRIPAKQLKEQLIELYNKGGRRPVLVPDEMSLSKDMLLAISLVEKIWKKNRKVIVEKRERLE